MFHKAGIAAVLLAGFLMVGSLVPAQARDHCEKRIRKAEDNLRKEVGKHGEHSTQAMYRRRLLEEARERCAHFRGRDRDRDRR
jgi:hypothetical protein